MAFVSLCVVNGMEEAISVSQGLPAWCSHGKRGFSAGIGCKTQR